MEEFGMSLNEIPRAVVEPIAVDYLAYQSCPYNLRLGNFNIAGASYVKVELRLGLAFGTHPNTHPFAHLSNSIGNIRCIVNRM
jgi:hypothetical protein